PRRVRIRVGTNHSGGVEAANLAGSGHLAGEPAAEVQVVRVIRVHHLDGNLAPAGRLAQVYPAHAALAQAAQQPKRANLAGVAGPQPIHPPHPPASPQDLARRLLQAGDTVTSPAAELNYIVTESARPAVLPRYL